MSPVYKNFQKFLILAFGATAIVLVFIGVNRSKNSAISATPSTPGQDALPAKIPATNVPSTGSKVFKGNTYQTPWGNAVASITVTNGKITGVTMPQVPPSPPSQYAEPYLIQQALAAGSANIQGVSGATYTSIAFKSSLESAIALAGAQGQAVTGASGATTVATPISKPSVPRRYSEDD